MIWSPEILKRLDAILATRSKDRVAVFDADGTLWHDDLGESFFKHQAQNNMAPGLQGIKDPWSYYMDLCAQGHDLAYGWLAQINAGMPEKALQKQAHDYYWNHFSQKLSPLFKDLIKRFKSAGFEVWICSASQRWALEPAVQDLELPLDRLIAVEVLVKKGILTDELVEPIPYKKGKRLWLEKKLPAQPLLIAGNSMGDLNMLEWAKEMPLVVIYKPHLPAIRESEEALLKEAARRHWPIQIFQ